jgi:hypothetical protein
MEYAGDSDDDWNCRWIFRYVSGSGSPRLKIRENKIASEAPYESSPLSKNKICGEHKMAFSHINLPFAESFPSAFFLKALSDDFVFAGVIILND